MTSQSTTEPFLPPGEGAWLIDSAHPTTGRLERTYAVPAQQAEAVSWLMMGFTRSPEASAIAKRTYRVGPHLRRLLGQVVPPEVMPDDDIVTIHVSWPEKGDPRVADTPPPAGVPPDLGVWILDFQHPGSNRVWQSTVVPNAYSLRLSCLMMGYTRVSRAHDMVVGGYRLTPTLSKLIRTLLPVESPDAGGGYVYIGQRVDGDP